MPQPLEPIVEHDTVPVPGLMLKFLIGVAGPAKIERLLNACTEFEVAVAIFVASVYAPHSHVRDSTRPNSREPFVIDMYVKSRREKSIKADSSNRNNGTTIANSVIACPGPRLR